MTTYTVVIIDDEQLAIDVIKTYLARFPQFELLETFTDPEDAFGYMMTHHVDLVFADIQMPNMSGVELAKTSRSYTKFIMVTSHSEYAIESFELDVIDYLLKPASFERFSLAIDRFMKYASHVLQIDRRPSFFIKEGPEYTKVYIQDIDYVESSKDYAKLYCGKNYYVVLKTLKSLEKTLERFNFIRIHKSFMVPLEKISQYNGRVVIVNSHAIQVGSKYREHVVEYLNKKKM
jgi:DNA-binding LytR/AlgR family response regulator